MAIGKLPEADVEAARQHYAMLRDLAGANPGALLFGTDLPSTRADRPFRDDDLSLVQETLPDDLARKALYENAVALYRPR